MRSRTQSKRDQVQNGIKWDAEEPRDGGLMVEEHSVLRSLRSNVHWQLWRTNSVPSKKRGKITFKGKIDCQLASPEAAPDYEIVDAKVTDSAVEVWLSDGRVIITPLSWYPTLEAASPKQRRAFENWGVGLAWENLDFHLSVEGMLAGTREFS